MTKKNILLFLVCFCTYVVCAQNRTVPFSASVLIGKYAGIDNYVCKGYSEGLYYVFAFAGDWKFAEGQNSIASSIVRDSRKSSFSVIISDVSDIIAQCKLEKIDLMKEFSTNIEVAQFLLEGSNPRGQFVYRKIELNRHLIGVSTDNAAYLQYTVTQVQPGISVALDCWAYLFFVENKLIVLGLQGLQSDNPLQWDIYYGLHQVMSYSFKLVNTEEAADYIVEQLKVFINKTILK